MEPKALTYEMCRRYVQDQTDVVKPALLKLIEGKLRSRDLAGLATCSCHFDVALHCVDDWRFLRQVEAFFKKNVLFADDEVCQDAAVKSFWSSELSCNETNHRLRHVAHTGPPTEELNGIYVMRMRRYIQRVLGDFQSFQDELPRLVRVTPGATATTKRVDSLPQLKMRLRPYVTPRAVKYVRAVYGYYGFENVRPKATHLNRVEFVPKNWKTKRTIACEPEGNLPLQLAFDTYVKRRLRKKTQLNLSDQSANQRLARHASVHNNYATVDFSAASDTVSYNTVLMLFPEEWFAYLADVRSPGFRSMSHDKQKVPYAKFSSMGNGATFCIETLIFAAACYAVTLNSDFLVYGDDVIIPGYAYEEYLSLTRFLGFTVNQEKSYADGPFRESCGGDFFNGVDVTPVFVRNINSQKAVLCHLVNTVRSVCSPKGKLEELMRDLIKVNHLPSVPFNESTMSGVWIDPVVARTRKLLVNRRNWDKRGIYLIGSRERVFSGPYCMYKAYVPKTKSRKFVCSRGYYLWFLNSSGNVRIAGPWAELRTIRPTITSSVPIYQHEYVRKWVIWRKPDTDMPDYLYWWSEQR